MLNTVIFVIGDGIIIIGHRRLMSTFPLSPPPAIIGRPRCRLFLMKKTNFILLKKRGPSISSDWVRRLYTIIVYTYRGRWTLLIVGGMIRHEPALRPTFLFTSNVLDKDDNLRGESSEFPYYHTDTWTICWADFLKKFPKMRALSRRLLLLLNSYWQLSKWQVPEVHFLWVNKQ